MAEITQKQLQALIERRHPEYDDMETHWEFLEACYRGGRAWFEENIFKYMKEGDTEFDDRVKRAYRFNHTREIVDLVNKYIFKEKIIRNKDDATDAVKRFWEKSTRNSLPIDQYMRQVSQKASTFGRVWLVVDNTAKAATVQTVQDEKQTDARTYSYVVRPQDVLDMSYDDKGELNWILIREVGRDDDDPFESSGNSRDLYRLWTRDYWVLYERFEQDKKITVEEVDGSDHNLGVVPVIKCDHVETDELHSAPALIGDIAYLDRAVANYLSNLDAIIQDQTFSQLAMPAQGILPGEDAYDKLIEMGTKRIFTYDGEHGAKPEFISPDPKQAELIVGVIRQVINEIYHSVGMAGERTKQDNSMGIDNSSGVAKAYDFERVNALLTSKADSLDRAEEKMIQLVNLWNGNENERSDLIKYADTYDVRGLSDEFEVAQQLSLIEAPSTVRREQMRVLVDKLFPRLAEDLKESIEAEIKDWMPSEEKEIKPGAVMSRSGVDDSSDEDQDEGGRDTGQS